MSLPPPALFLDRDGTLIEDLHYQADPQKVRLLPGVREGLQQFHQQGWLFFLFSNQSGIRRGLCTLEAVEACNQKMLQTIGLGENLFARTCLALGTPEQPCEYRKPSPKFILECLGDYSLLPDRCWMIGDKETDVQSGCSAHIHTLLLTPIPCNTQAEACCANFFEVTALLLKNA
ncbi:MAG: HAD-IIIA family hydrolase [Opitutales bacterium]|nr:HAD-IIIA family hydrolase [Opitutales bacterium]